jgi:hypothetical protein
MALAGADHRSRLLREDWGSLAKQALENVLQASSVLADRVPPLPHELAPLSTLAGIDDPC